RDGDERLVVARGKEHTTGDGLCGRRERAGTPERGRSEPDSLPPGFLGRAAASEDDVREERFGANCRGPVCKFLGQGGRGQHRTWHPACDGNDFRQRHAGGAGIPTSRKSLRKTKYGKESNCSGEVADPGWKGHPGASSRHGTWPAGRQYYGFLQGL